MDFQVGLPNVGKSTLFNTLTKLSIPAENFPFCTIEPNEARVHVPDERFEWLCQLYKPKSEVCDPYSTTTTGQKRVAVPLFFPFPLCCDDLFVTQLFIKLLHMNKVLICLLENFDFL